MWIFGYGSLVWRPALAYSERVVACVHGWRRRFWQGSPDHRGTPLQPGRVATLLPAGRGEICWGAAYRLAPAQVEATLRRLDVREVAGYRRCLVDISLRPGGPRIGRALLYTALPHNPSYLGPAPMPEMAAHILRCRGRSGTNVEYVVRLAEALRAASTYDPHVAAVADALRGHR